MKKPYKYQRPAGSRHVVSIRGWNKTFANRGRWPFVTCHVFLDHEQGKAVIHFYATIWGKLFVTLMFPVLVVLSGYRDAAEAVKCAWFQRARGAFSSDTAVAGRSDWDKLLGLLSGYSVHDSL